MADYTLLDGTEVAFDLNAITLAEYRALFDREQPPEHEDAAFARICGMTLDQYQALGYKESRDLARAVLQRMFNPYSDPNSASASTTT